MSQSGPYATFGSGLLIAKTASAVVNFACLQDITFEINGKPEKLYGQYRNALASAMGTVDITLKAKTGYVSGPIYSALVYGIAPSVGTVSLIYQESHSVPAVTPFTVTVANSATFTADFGVSYAATGAQLQPVASGPTLGQYSVSSSGVYTFAATDASAGVLISYTYAQATVGSTLVVPNQLQGVAPTFSMIVQRSFNGVGERFLFNSVTVTKLSLPTQMAKFAISEVDFDVFAPNGTSPFSLYTDV